MSLTLFLPAALADTGNAIMRSLDPDVGGDKTFGLPNYTQSGVDYVATSIPDVMPLAPNAAWWLADPSELQAFVEADYLVRWPNNRAPTQAEVTTFSNSVIAVNDESIIDVALRFGFEPVVPTFIYPPNQGENNNGNS